MNLEFTFSFKNFSDQKKEKFPKNNCVLALFYNFDS